MTATPSNAGPSVRHPGTNLARSGSATSRTAAATPAGHPNRRPAARISTVTAAGEQGGVDQPPRRERVVRSRPHDGGEHHRHQRRPGQRRVRPAVVRQQVALRQRHHVPVGPHPPERRVVPPEGVPLPVGQAPADVEHLLGVVHPRRRVVDGRRQLERPDGQEQGRPPPQRDPTRTNWQRHGHRGDPYKVDRQPGQPGRTRWTAGDGQRVTATSCEAPRDVGPGGSGHPSSKQMGDRSGVRNPRPAPGRCRRLCRIGVTVACVFAPRGVAIATTQATGGRSPQSRSLHPHPDSDPARGSRDGF